jgi:hypothetical protein
MKLRACTKVHLELPDHSIIQNDTVFIKLKFGLQIVGLI